MNLVLEHDRAGLIKLLQEGTASDVMRAEQIRQLIRALRVCRGPGDVVASIAAGLTVGFLVGGIIVWLLMRTPRSSAQRAVERRVRR
jgi:hypothetical protein